jgi:hypothetical protein
VKLARDDRGLARLAGTCRIILTRDRFSQLWPVLDFTPDETRQITEPPLLFEMQMVQRENVELVRALHWDIQRLRGSCSTTSRRGCQTFVTVAVPAHTTDIDIDHPTAERFDKTKMYSIKGP